MASFKKTRDVLFQSYHQGLIWENELIVLLEEDMARNLEFNYASYDHLDLDVIDNPECKANFRFEKQDLPVLDEALHLPQLFRFSQGTVADQMEGRCMYTQT